MVEDLLNLNELARQAEENRLRKAGKTTVSTEMRSAVDATQTAIRDAFRTQIKVTAKLKVTKNA